MKNLIIIVFFFSLISCSKNSVKPILELIQKQWIAKTIKENDLTVFNKDETTNIRQGYSQFRLILSLGSVTFTDFDGTTFSGEWEISSDEKMLILKNLVPEPTGTSGKLEFIIIRCFLHYFS
jgi:hypothetical protein